MASFCEHLHKSVFPIPGIQAESQPHGQRTGYRSKGKAYPLADTGHIQDNYREKHRYDSPGKKEQVLRFQPLELHRTPRALVNAIVHCLKEERTENGRGNNQEDTGKEPAGCRLGRIRVPTAELSVGLDTSDQTQHGPDGITELGSRIEIRSHEAGRLIDTGKAFALRKNTC